MPPQPQSDLRDPDKPLPTPPAAKAASGSALLVTNLWKACGIYLVFHEAVLRPSVRESVLYVGLALAIGSQAVENALLRLIDRVFTRE
jgi:hypothetical protein